VTKSCQHKPHVPAPGQVHQAGTATVDIELGYTADAMDAEARLARGEEQGACPFCGKWFWPDAFFTRTDYLEAADCADSRLATTAYEERRALREAVRNRRRPPGAGE
jgi:hypothetical protein